MTNPAGCGCGVKGCEGGVFPECGCIYTEDDDGIHFCPLHASAPELLKTVKEVSDWIDENLADLSGRGPKTKFHDIISRATPQKEATK